MIPFFSGLSKTSEGCELSPKKLKRKKSDRSRSESKRKRKKVPPSEQTSDDGTNKESENCEPKSSKIPKLDLENLVLDYLGQEGFEEVRNDLATALRKRKTPDKKSPKSGPKKAQPKTVSNISCVPTSFSDFFVYSYLVSNPDFAEVAKDLEKVRGPFLGLDLRAEDVVPATKRKRKSSGSGSSKRVEDSQVRESGGGVIAADRLPSSGRPNVTEKPIPKQLSSAKSSVSISSI